MQKFINKYYVTITKLVLKVLEGGLIVVGCHYL